jgi:hypothetical protein
VLDVVTADRVVAQISTEHLFYDKGHVPSVTFLGTRFDNLRIAGHKVEVEQNLNVLGPRHDDDRSYLEDPDVQNRIAQQYHSIATAKDLPKWAKGYAKSRPALNGHGELNCSVINKVTGTPGASFGHIIDLPHFGKIFFRGVEGRTKGRTRVGQPCEDDR